MAKLLRVRIIDAWRGYNANSIVTMTEKAYYENKKAGVNLSLITDSAPTNTPVYQTRPITPITKNEIEEMHDKPFIVIDEEE
jgi:hypothetical protein